MSSYRLATLSALVVLSLIVSPTAGIAGVISWSGNTWTHGSSSFTGWQAGQASGTTTDTSGVGVTVTNTKFGTATGAGSDRSLVPVGAMGNFFAMVQNNDFLGGSGSNPTNYGTTTISFSTAVNVTNFRLFDVDDQNNATWQDFIAVVATNGATGVSTTYTIGPDQQLQTRHGLSGVLGINNVNYTGGNPNAFVGLSFGGPVTSLTVYFFQGPQGTGATGGHIIVLDNITITPVPEASTLALCGVGMLAFVGLRRRKNRTS